ncbi:MAG: DUF4249 domain-containing protein [Cyclobacteriaceae bacterium]|nr:DUF4249 domain-containing protein [Cyclobacteriaceae bacterium HetDA_MAG_MS6]
MEPIDIGVSTAEGILVVDMSLGVGDTNEVKLSRTGSLTRASGSFEGGATITLKTLDGGRYDFNPIVLSDTVTIYQNYDELPGDKVYFLEIETADGEEYISDEVRPVPPTSLNDLYYDIVAKPLLDGNEVLGLEFYVDAQNDHTPYYRWEWEATWELTTSRPSAYELIDGEVVLRDEQITLCWQNKSTENILVASAEGFEANRISKFPLVFEDNANNEISRQYHLELRQYGLSLEAYRYWLEQQKISEGQGELFDPQPYQLTGNIRNVNDPDEIVIGYFDVHQAVTRSLFLDLNDLESFQSDLLRCLGQDTIEFEFVEAKLKDGFYIFRTYQPPPPPGGPLPPLQYVMVLRACADCRLYGNNEKPPFWPE